MMFTQKQVEELVENAVKTTIRATLNRAAQLVSDVTARDVEMVAGGCVLRGVPLREAAKLDRADVAAAQLLKMAKEVM
ncbi:hypothetical protein GOB94_13955 [Granulicella sp. 5B5]|uniref:hypothetical protein n=1 Tax=Granulicella sp. 5B5 TaxID=1617967 RepID=UPI0015F69EA3|nr:hypothetical protein [Granulicella sp. 5B5]QMV19670.1 hypothetical protein GOB94_13955 [Granulicella sp. 5B5]